MKPIVSPIESCEANTFYGVQAVVIQSIDLSSERKQSCGKLDPPSKPPEVQMGPNMSDYRWTATQDCETSVVPHNPDAGPTYGLLSDSDIRDTVATADASSLTRIPLAERLRITNRLFEGWVSGPDLEAIKRLYTTTPQADRAALRQLIEQWIPRLTSIGQRTELRAVLSQSAP